MGLISEAIPIFLLCCHLSKVVGADKNYCSPLDDKYIKNGKCRPCRPCDVGRGRNFTQVIVSQFFCLIVCLIGLILLDVYE